MHAPATSAPPAFSGPALLDVRDLCITLPTARGPGHALRHVSFTLERGATLGLIGESGCGKSMTALAVLGLLPAGAEATGSIRLNGQELLGLADAAMCRVRGNRIGMVFQEPMTALNPLHTVGAQIAEPLRLHRGLGAEAARAEALRLLERVRMPQAHARLGAYPHQLSGGQRQRVTIAIALACGPELLIADEPTTALDATLQGEILGLIDDLVRESGMGLVLISHDLGVMARHVRRLLVMYGGAGVEAGPAERVFAVPAHPYTRGLVAARPSLAAARVDGRKPRLVTIPGRVPELADVPPGCPFADRCGWALGACRTALPAFEPLAPGHAARCIRLHELDWAA